MTLMAVPSDTPDTDADLRDGVRYVNGPLEHQVTFSVCSLLLRDTDYDRLLASFRKFGFTEDNSEFIAVDNRGDNSFDGYELVRRCLPECSGRYVIFCHDDVELIDQGFDDLVATLEQLETQDPTWAVAGVAGGILGKGRDNDRQVAVLISDKFGDRQEFGGPFPRQVESVDECFFVIPRDRAVMGSLDLTGFHFFGSDLCLQAEMSGGTSYVIGFHLYHHGQATENHTYFEGKDAFAAKYAPYFPGRVLETTTNKVPLEKTENAGVKALARKAKKALRRFH